MQLMLFKFSFFKKKFLSCIRINKAVDAAVREREDRLSAENAQLRAALIAMQR